MNSAAATDSDLPLLLICPRCRQLNAEGRLECHAIVHPQSRQPAFPGPSLHSVSVLECSNLHCRARYPVVEGIPVIFRDPRALDLTLSPPVDVLSLGTERLLALADGQLPSSGLHTLLARLARYLRAGFGDWIEEALGESTKVSAPAIHAVEVLAWMQSLGEAHHLSAAAQAIAAATFAEVSSDEVPVLRASLGCALGREAFEVDSPTLLVDAHLTGLLVGQRLRRDGRLDAIAPISACQWAPLTVTVPLPARASVAYVCTDVLDPPFLAGAFGSVMALNLIDSVSDPVTAIGQAAALVAEGGMLTLTSPFAWREEVTPPERWLERQGVPVGTRPETVLMSLLEQNFPSSRKLKGRKAFPWTMQNFPHEQVLYRSIGWCWG